MVHRPNEETIRLVSGAQISKRHKTQIMLRERKPAVGSRLISAVIVLRRVVLAGIKQGKVNQASGQGKVKRGKEERKGPEGAASRVCCCVAVRTSTTLRRRQ